MRNLGSFGAQHKQIKGPFLIALRCIRYEFKEVKSKEVERELERRERELEREKRNKKNNNAIAVELTNPYVTPPHRP